MDAEESKKNCVRADADPQRPRNGKEHRFMKNWKKLLACLLVSLMALTVFTACDASVGAPMGPKRSTAESAKALCDRFKVSYSEELSEKAYNIANWVAGTSVSCDTNDNKTELYRVGNANDITKTSLLQHKYATAFESMGMGIYGSDEDFVPGFYIDTDLDSRKDYIRFVLPKDGIVTDAMKSAAVGKTKLGVAYVVKDGVSYAVVLFGK
jgi:hypothetical protein